MSTEDNVTIKRLEEQIAWYDEKASWARTRFRLLKVVSILLATSIPVLCSVPDVVPAWVLGALGAVVAILEAVQQLYQYQSHWLSYRSTCEALKHEKFLYLAHAAQYAETDQPLPLLAVRIEALISQEHAKWATLQSPTSSNKTGANAPANSEK